MYAKLKAPPCRTKRDNDGATSETERLKSWSFFHTLLADSSVGLRCKCRRVQHLRTCGEIKKLHHVVSVGVAQS